MVHATSGSKVIVFAVSETFEGNNTFMTDGGQVESV